MGTIGISACRDAVFYLCALCVLCGEAVTRFATTMDRIGRQCPFASFASFAVQLIPSPKENGEISAA